MNELTETDVLVIGSGIAGGIAALKVAQKGAAVVVVTRARDPHDTNTNWAQGGIIYKGAAGSDDSAALLIQDLNEAGDFHNNPVANRILADEGPGLVEAILIDEIKVDFTRDAHGELSIVLEGGHRAPRIIHAADATGRAIQIALLNKLKVHPNITLLTAHTAIDLLTPQHHSANRLAIYDPITCVGAYVLDQDQGIIRRILASKTILASGGLGQIFLRTSNPKGSRGDGLAMAYRAGARVINNEFVQFHPTTFAKKGAPNFLVSEAVRGEGGRLVHEDGEPFMDKYEPKWKDLAPRDVVSRSIHTEMQLHDLSNVYLDLRSYMDTAHILHHFPNIQKACLEHGVDMTTDLVPVTPAAHYFCGGVWVDAAGQTTIRDLYAVGEVSCTGLHGANRLASSSLLEGLVWGVRAAEHAYAHLHERPRFAADCIPEWRDTSQYETDPLLIQQDMQSIKSIMWNYVGLVRAGYRLWRADRELRHLEGEIGRFYRESKLTDELIGLRNMVRAGLIVTDSAARNKKSMGCHYRLEA